MNIRTFTYLLVVAPLFLISCHDTKKIDTLSRLSVGVELRPDSVLQVLNSMKKTTKLSEMDEARWNLLYVRAFDEKTLDIPNDSIVLSATEILCNEGTHLEKAYSNFYLGRMHANREKNNEAMANYIKALDLAKEIREYGLAGLICNYMGEIYSKDKRYDKRIEMLKESLSFFVLARDMRGQIFALRDIAHGFLFKELPDSALLYCAQAEVLARKINDQYALNDILYEFGNSYWIKKDSKSSEFYIKKAIEFAVDSDQKKKFNVALIDIYAKQERWIEAKNMIKSLIKEANVPVTMQAANKYRMSNIEEKLGNYREALRWYREYISLYDSLNVSRKEINTRDIEKEHREMALQNRMSYLESINIVILIILVIFIVLFLVYIVRYFRMFKENVANLSRMNLLKNDINQLNEELQDYKEQLLYQSDIAQKAALLHGIPFHKRSELAEKIKGIFDSPSINEDDWINFDTSIEVAYPGFVKKLSDTYPELTQEEVRVLMLKYLGMDNSKLSTIYCIQPQSMLTKQYRIRKKMKLKHEETVEDIVNEMINSGRSLSISL